MTTAAILLQAGSGGMSSLIMMGLIVVVFYFFMIRPQMKKQKDHKKYIEDLKVNDKVVTTAGIHGRIVEIGESTFIIDVGSGTRIKFDKAAISLDASKLANTPKQGTVTTTTDEKK
ncbi:MULTISPECIES: preprotein translocase subunit YajC [Olivibacter]|jgi:preprotein translocase subunit YajC|uniref:Sec translocon accessory complex subunit YajC n=2 Tax=Olivibacter TaxID=376469 RepID=A0ABV6HP40_9SPHI|nr:MULTISPECIES: preprotein translocase subunit YajC [Olivibacter]MCL4640868.1 preprotein translocase subunit YajC [Olivibacter sp. UJ_SKK_5.1]MDX3914344.1 preprotein translocase subunit YajC [Pseudosphingobacterium sp.]QEL02470.1 preprotein translocase subunit YajC [Olivibacter sp. LS-1]